MLAELGLHADPASTQIVQRDRHAALLTSIAIVGGSLERFATEIRNLQHTEIGELLEPFKAGQKGSCAMPHKRNPILSERIAGLARLLRGYAAAALEDQPLWHERDISQLERRAGDPARRDDRPRLHARPDDGPRRGPRRPRRADAREHRARPRAARQQPRPRARSSSAAGCPARTPTRSSSGPRSARPTSAAAPRPARRRPGRSPRELTPHRPRRLLRRRAFLRHVPAVIARLDSLEAEVHVAR